MHAAKARLERATAALHQALASGGVREKRAARREHKAAADDWERACALPEEHYCGPCGKTHSMGNHGILVLKRAIGPGGEEFERSHDLHIVLCAEEWRRLRVADLIDRQRKQESEA